MAMDRRIDHGMTMASTSRVFSTIFVKTFFGEVLELCWGSGLCFSYFYGSLYTEKD